MRRKDREMSPDCARMVLDDSLWVTLAMLDPEGRPYAVPVSIVREDETIYFHAAKTGRKTRCLQNRPQICLVAVGEARPVSRCFSMEYSSAVVHGVAREVLDDEEKIHALRLLCLRYAKDNMDSFDEAVKRSLSRTAIWKVSIDKLSGKSKEYAADGSETTIAGSWPAEPETTRRQ